MVNKSLSNVVVLISGSGSNLQSLIDNADDIGIKITCVISNVEDAFGLSRAKTANIPTRVITRGKFSTNAQFDEKLAKYIQLFKPKLIILAGFMRILSFDFVKTFEGRILNIHPALLPKFKGLNTHQRAIDAREKYTGASVHFVTNELDSGEIVMQKIVAIDPDDNAKTLAEKVLKQEHILYPLAIKSVLSSC